MKPSPEQVREWDIASIAYADETTDQYPCWEDARNMGFAELAAQWGAEQAQHEAENAPWLTIAHMICTDAGIAHGPISGRLEALRDKLADKAQQTTEETDAEMALRSIASWLGVGGFNAPTVDAKVFEQKIYEGVEMAIKSHYATAEEPELPEAAINVSPYDPNHVYWNAGHPNDGVNSPLFTAAQMHDHFQAGVLVGMGDSQWRTIDSAPKDGAVILGYRDGRIGTASMVPRSDCEMWTFCGTSADVENYPKVKPTHWMPLPTPPAMQGGQK